MGAIYRIFNVATDAFYIGSAVNPRRRKWEHWDGLKKNTHHCRALQNAWNDFGEDAFTFEILEEVGDDKLLQVEDTYLAQHHGKPGCYNTASSTFMTPAYQMEVRVNISESLKRKYAEDKTYAPRVGTTHTEATKQVIREKKLANPTRAWLGKTRDEATRKKIGDAQRGVAKAPRVYTPEGLERVRANMVKNARTQEINTIDAVIAKFPLEIQQRYDFTNAVYTGALSRITGCVCPKHGGFSQYAAQLRKGRGCPMCGAVIRGEKKTLELKAKWSDPEARAKMMEARKKCS